MFCRWINFLFLASTFCSFAFAQRVEIPEKDHSRGYAQGQYLQGYVCPDPSHQMKLVEVSSKILQWAEAQYYLFCDKDPEIYVLGIQEQKGIPILAVLKKDSPESLFAPLVLKQSTVGIFNTEKPEKGEANRYSEERFYLDAQATASHCLEGQVELRSIRAITSFLSKAQEWKIWFEKPRSYNVCLPRDIRLTSLQPLNILDYRTEETGELTLAVYLRAYTKKDNVEPRLYVLSLNTIDAKLKWAFELPDAYEKHGGQYTLFPQGCGVYFMTARFLPGVQKLALFHKHPRVFIVNYSDKSKVLVDEVYNGATKEFLASCEAYSPHYMSLREGKQSGDFEEVIIKDQALYFKNFNKDLDEPVLTKIKY